MQPSEVPIWVQNRTSDRRTVTVECTETRSTDVLVSTAVELGPEEEESVYIEPVEENGEYDVTISLDDYAATESFSGGGVRDIDVAIRSATTIRFDIVET